MKALPEKKRQNKQTKVRMQNALANASRSENLTAISQTNGRLGMLIFLA